MTAAHEVSAERKPINIAKKRNNTSIYANIDLRSSFLERIPNYSLGTKHINKVILSRFV